MCKVKVYVLIGKTGKLLCGVRIGIGDAFYVSPIGADVMPFERASEIAKQYRDLGYPVFLWQG